MRRIRPMLGMENVPTGVKKYAVNLEFEDGTIIPLFELARCIHLNIPVVSGKVYELEYLQWFNSYPRHVDIDDIIRSDSGCYRVPDHRFPTYQTISTWLKQSLNSLLQQFILGMCTKCMLEDNYLPYELSLQLYFGDRWSNTKIIHRYRDLSLDLCINGDKLFLLPKNSLDVSVLSSAEVAKLFGMDHIPAHIKSDICAWSSYTTFYDLDFFKDKVLPNRIQINQTVLSLDDPIAIRTFISRRDDKLGLFEVGVTVRSTVQPQIIKTNMVRLRGFALRTAERLVAILEHPLSFYEISSIRLHQSILYFTFDYKKGIRDQVIEYLKETEEKEND